MERAPKCYSSTEPWCRLRLTRWSERQSGRQKWFLTDSGYLLLSLTRPGGHTASTGHRLFWKSPFIPYPTHLTHPLSLQLRPNTPNLLSFLPVLDYRSPGKRPSLQPRNGSAVTQNPLWSAEEGSSAQWAKQILFSRQERTEAGNPHILLFLIP